MSYFTKKGSRVLTVKVTNLGTGREDIHKNISKEEVEWIKLTPGLEVEIMEVSMRGRSKKKSEK